MGHLAGAAFAAIYAFPISRELPTPEFGGAQLNTDLTAAAQKAGACCICFCNQLNGLTPMGSSDQPSASSEQ